MTEISQIQEAQAHITKNLRLLEERQEEFFQLQQQEQRLYHELTDTSAPEERNFFRERGENSFVWAKKGQTQLAEQEDELREQLKQLMHQEELIYHEQRKAQLKKEGW